MTHFHCLVPHVAFKFPFVDPFEPPNPLSAQVQDLLACQLERTLLNESEVEFGGDRFIGVAIAPRTIFQRTMIKRG